MQHIKNIIKKLLNTKFKEMSETTFILENWEKIVGKDIAENTLPIKLYKSTLFINVKNSVIMEEMIYRKNELIEKINNVFKDKKVKHIIFKI